ncbi:MAG: response regulator [Aquincola tertiaricarbonis]
MDSERRLRVLIADDSEDLAHVTAELIRLALPADVETVYDGVAALERALAWQPDVVLLDLYMPGLDGIEVARRLRQAALPRRPFCIAVTGRPDAAGRLDAIDSQFDRVFAKPLDVDLLIAALARLARPQPPEARPQPHPFNLGELFTRAARQVMPVARHLSFSFDYRGPGVVVEGESIDVHCGLHRMLLGAVDMLADGFVLFTAETTLLPGGGCSTLVQAAGTGTLHGPARLADVLARMHLLAPETPDAAGADAAGPPHSAVGRCPNTGATVRFTLDPHEGILLRAELRFPRAEQDESAHGADATGARAWLVDSDEVPAAWLHRRLQRLGWRVTRFARCEDAVSQATEPGMRAPSLLVVVESPLMRPTAPLALQQALPHSTQAVLAVMAGSPWLGSPETLPGFDIRVYPFSPLELAEFASIARPDQPTRSGSSVSGATLTGALGLADRPLVLLVDDNEINRLVGRALVEALGYEVLTANDGLDAIDQCRINRPQVVLMDLDMPVLKGVEATVRLRELQRTGEMPPFSIIAATADATVEAREACARSGMDGFMSKPLDIAELRSQLRRFSAARV